MKSIRKFLLENKDKKESYKIAKEFCGYWTSSQINQLRKFLICSNPMNMNDFNNLLSYIKNNNIHFWPILDVFFKVYSKLSIEEFWKFLKNKKTIEYIQLFYRNEGSYEDDCIFFKFREYSLKHIENNY